MILTLVDRSIRPEGYLGRIVSVHRDYSTALKSMEKNKFRNLANLDIIEAKCRVIRGELLHKTEVKQ